MVIDHNNEKDRGEVSRSQLLGELLFFNQDRLLVHGRVAQVLLEDALSSIKEFWDAGAATNIVDVQGARSCKAGLVWTMEYNMWHGDCEP